jgi:hypothetical protein
VNVKEQKDSKSPPQVNVKDSRSKTLSVVPKNKDGEKKAEEKKRLDKLFYLYGLCKNFL